MIRSKNHIFDYRLRLVHHATADGVKPTARAFQTTVKTVRKWRDRYLAEGSSGLLDRSRATHTCPHKLSRKAEQTIIKHRKLLPGFGAQHLKDEFDFPWGVNAIARVIRVNCPTRRRKKKHKKKNDLRAIKAALKPFTHFQMDVKYLNDIPPDHWETASPVRSGRPARATTAPKARQAKRTKGIPATAEPLRERVSSHSAQAKTNGT